MIKDIFLKHPKEENMSYGEHCLVALSLSFILFFLSIILIVHAFIPGFFKNTASNMIYNFFGERLERK